MTPDQLLREALEVLKWIDVWGREANGDGRYYVVAFDSPAGIKLRHVVTHARNEATHADWNNATRTDLAESCALLEDGETSNPFVAPCGAKFDTYDEMAHHSKKHEAAK